MRTGDHVFHGPSEETWVVAWADHKTGYMSPCGWPECQAKIADCTITKRATDEEFSKLVDQLSKSGRRDASNAARIRSALEAETGGGDDWTVDDTLTAREILNYLGIGSDASLEPFADRRRDHVAKIIQKRIAATPPAERVVEALLDERQKRAEQVHDRILAARDGIRVNLSPDSPEWLRDAFNKLHEAHHIMGGDPFDMHMRAALAAKDAVKDDETVVEVLVSEQEIDALTALFRRANLPG